MRARPSLMNWSAEALLFFGLWRQDALDLLQVVKVVAGHHVQDALDSFLAAFGMHAVMLPLFRFQRFEHHEVGVAHRSKYLQALAGIALAVSSSGNPGFLVISLDRGSRRAEDRTNAPRGNNFRVAQMRKDLGHRPFVRRRLFAKLSGRLPGDQLLQIGRAS